MVEEKVLKPKTFRIDEETADKIRKISETIGGNQQEAFAKLIETYELQSSKSILPDQKGNIEQFEKYINALTRIYMVSLETNQNITETVRTEFDALLKSKDITIQELQDQLLAAQKSIKDSMEKAENLKKKTVELKDAFASKESDYMTQIANFQSMIIDKDNLNQALTNSYKEEKQKNNSLQEKITLLEQEKKELSNVKEELFCLKTEKDQLLKNNENLEKELKKAEISYNHMVTDLKQKESFTLEQYKQQSQLELQKTILDMEKKYQEQIQELKKQRQAEIDEYQKKYFILLEKLQSRKKVPKD